MVGGYVKLHRKIVDSDVFENANVLKVFIWCLASAQFEDERKGNNLEYGQFYTTRELAAKANHMPSSTWHWAMSRLVELGSVKMESIGNRKTMITVCNFRTYQNKKSEDWQPIGSRLAADWQPIDNLPLVQECKKERMQEGARPQAADLESTEQSNSDGHPHSPEWLARTWVHYRRGTRGRDELIRATEHFAEMIRLGCDPAQIGEEIESKDRDRTEPLWAFQKRLAPAKAKNQPNPKATRQTGGLASFIEEMKAKSKGKDGPPR